MMRRYQPNAGANPAGFGGGPLGTAFFSFSAPDVAADLLAGGAPARPKKSKGDDDAVTSAAGGATFSSGGGAGGGSRFWIFHQAKHFGGWPAPPRVHFA
jgi:hypothetical protein